MELPVSSDCGVYPSTDKILYKDGNSGVNMASSSQDVAPQQPAIKQTRQWAAWTRQEEERFFTALRQVGKNFEKITYRVQSKNKDQVRHYYYRLVRRMNKLLDPQLCLDAKNSKDTNSAMLRWWSLLEKSSCKASKLHLKPRRFKMFLDALEHQLLKDRRKNIRKRHSQGEVCSTTATANVLSQGKALMNDIRTVEVVILDSQNFQKLGSGKGSLLNRNANLGVNRSNCKGDLIPLKAVRQRRKPGNGLFIFRMAPRRKDLNYLGLDINKKLVERCVDTVHQSGIRNVNFLATNATSTFRSIVSTYPGEVVLVSIQCPIPDFRKPEHRWQLLQRSLVEAIVDLLAYDGKVFLQSDIKEVVLRMKEQFSVHGKGKLHIENRVEWLEENPFGVRSDWEDHVLDRGAPMYRLLLSKPSSKN